MKLVAPSIAITDAKGNFEILRPMIIKAINSSP